MSENLSKNKVIDYFKNYQVENMSINLLIIITSINLIAAYLNLLPSGWLAVGLMLTLGITLNAIGDNIPIFSVYFGGGALLAIFGSSAMVEFHIIGEDAAQNISDLYKSGGFMNAFIAALITGSILGLDRETFIKAAAKFLPVVLGGLFVALILTGIVGSIFGYGFSRSMLFFAAPIMGGGLGAGAVPIAEIMGSKLLDHTAEDVMTAILPAVALGNALAVIAAGGLSSLGNYFPKLSGDGRLLKDQHKDEVELKSIHSNRIPLYSYLMFGVTISLTFYTAGYLLSKLVPIGLHTYVWMISLVGLFKVMGWMPRKYERGCSEWFKLQSKIFIPAILTGVGITFVNFGDILTSLNIELLVLTLTTLIGCIIGSALMGHLLGMYVIEAAIAGGLCMANMGGSGDIAVLSAAKRMSLMPFAQISSRIGGAIVLLILSLLIHLLL